MKLYLFLNAKSQAKAYQYSFMSFAQEERRNENGKNKIGDSFLE